MKESACTLVLTHAVVLAARTMNATLSTNFKLLPWLLKVTVAW
jgi:hypothetical protein